MPRPAPPVLAAFVLSGMAGLAYEVAWSRYLALFVGHGAYAQVLVLAVYLGGMAVGSAAVAGMASRVRRPLAWYAGVEGALAVGAWLFHPVFVGLTGWAHATLFPTLPTAGLVGAARWGLAGFVILPPAVLLGATFPLMAASLVRDNPGRPGGQVATAYLANTLGGAGGVLLAGFWAIGTLGLPGTMKAAGALNLAAAGLAGLVALGRARGAAGAAAFPGGVAPAPGGTEPGSAPRPGEGRSGAHPGLVPLLLAVSFGTAVASFGYEISWIRMLSLVLGSATHAFELMLSAFILGLALGALLIRRLADDTRDPVRLLGFIQVSMGAAAVLTLPVYAWTFGAMATLVSTLSGPDGSYGLFNAARYAMCLAVMLPATVLAGATLPLLTGALLRQGGGERVIGQVYAVNTAGAVLGVGVAGLVALPLLGLKGLLVAAAALDVALGAWLLAGRPRGAGRHPGAAGVAVAGAALVLVGVGVGIRMDRQLLTSGVYRYGALPGDGARRLLFYRDGRTATVTAYLVRDDQTIVLATNGKPDASLGTRWYEPGRDTLPPKPVEEGQDFTTQIVGPLVGLAHNPRARSAANIGHGSGLTGAALLTSSSLQRLVTVEIEPAMVEGSFVFLPLNQAVFDDPRSTFVFDDAKSFLSHGRERFDLIFSEPSNPWVSGTSSLFTQEFYRTVAGHLTPGGVLAQWIQLYEVTDDLVLTVLKALEASLPYYRAYLVGDSDLVVVAGLEAFPDADWSMMTSPAFRELTAGMPPIQPEHMEALFLFDQETLRPVLDRGVRANSDFHPVLDLGAERARFQRRSADGIYSLAANRFDLRRMLSGERQLPLPFAPVPARGLGPAMTWGRGAWLREAMDAGGGIAPEEHPEWQASLVNLKAFLDPMGLDDPPDDWEAWAAAFDRAERELHWGTAGWVHEGFYRLVRGYLQRAGAPAEAHAVLAVLHGGATHDWAEAARGGDALVGAVALGRRWVRPSVLLDVAVTAYLHEGRVNDARRALDVLAPRSGRPAGHLRIRILQAAIDDREASPSGNR